MASTAEDVDLVDIDRELVSRPGGLRAFVDMAWSQLEPAREFQPNWHIDAIAEHLEAVFRREILRLVINVPPGTMKSLLACVCWPAWSWTQQPDTKWITASYSARISRRDALRARQLMETPWYRERWGGKWDPNPEAWSATEYRNTQAGFRMSTTVGGGATGEHGDIQVVDDPIKPIDAGVYKVDTVGLQTCSEWWDGTMSTRLVDPAKSARMIIMQRLHERDLSGHVLEQGGYEHIMLPMRFETKRKCFIETTGWSDPRTEEEELLWPERFPEDALKIRSQELGPIGVAGQEQQRPSPAKGDMIQRDWIRYYDELPEKATHWLCSWDMSFKETKRGSYVVGQVWCRDGPKFYLVEQYRRRIDFPTTLHAFANMVQEYPKIREKLVEDAANGPAVIATLKQHISGIVAVKTGGMSKESRLSACSYLLEAGNVYFPSVARASWVKDLVEELVAFPNVTHNDQVDALSMALNRYKGNRTPRIKMNLSVGAQSSPWRF